MGRYIQRRILIGIPILLAITVLIFTLLQLTPGDPLDTYAPPDQPMPAAQREALRHELGLDRPVVIQYGYWLRETVQGNLGYRAKTFEPVTEAIGRRIGPTLLLVGTAMVVGIGLGVALGVLAAVRQYSFLDTIMTIFAFIGISMPAYLAGLIGLYVFALRFDWFPAGGYSTPGEPFSAWDRIHHLILPAAIISVNYIASTMRYTRSAMLEVLGQDYVRTARAKGLDERIVQRAHVLRTALIPVVTLLGGLLPSLLSGAIIMEGIFNWPGMGRLFIEAASSRDYPLLLGMLLLGTVLTIVGAFLADIGYGLVDPRVRYS